MSGVWSLTDASVGVWLSGKHTRSAGGALVASCCSKDLSVGASPAVEGGQTLYLQSEGLAGRISPTFNFFKWRGC